MDLMDLSRIVSKICGPFLIVMSPIFILLLGLDPWGTDGQSASIKEWIFILLIGLCGLAVGIYMCKKEFGWFQKKH